MKSKKFMIEKLISDFKSYNFALTMLRISGSSNNDTYESSYKILEYIENTLINFGMKYLDLLDIVDKKNYKLNMQDMLNKRRSS